MRLLLAIATLVACFEAWAQVTLPHDLQPNTKASASKVMENFRALESAIEGIGGCTATQQDNSVLIECADGSSGVLAGAGTVVILPEGTTGIAPDLSSIPIGNFYWEDGTGNTIAEYYNSNFDENGEGVIDVLDEGGRRMAFQQTNIDQSLELRHGGTWTVKYPQDNCEGAFLIKFNQPSTDAVLHLDGSYWAKGDPLSGETLIRSQRLTDYFNYSTDEWVENACESIANPSPGDGWIGVTYEPPSEWINATYPLTLVQKP